MNDVDIAVFFSQLNST